MNGINSILQSITPPPFVNPIHYDGLEFKWKVLVFRPAQLKMEGILLAGIAAYVLLTLIGKTRNSLKANNWLKVFMPLYTQQFSTPSVNGLVMDGYSDFFNFSTGRRNVASLFTVFKLKPRHDVFQSLFHLFYSLIDLNYKVIDDLQLDFKLSAGAVPGDFVWAVVAKEELLNVKKDRWDLTFTKTSENSALHPTLSVMSEYADVTENIFKHTAILDVLKDASNLSYFRSLSVTDQPRLRPLGPEEREKHVILSLRLPSKPSDTSALVTAVFALVDNLHKIVLRPETKTKLRKTREDLDKELKVEAEREKKEEITQAKEDQRAAKRKVEEERVAKLPAAEQQKILEKERKKSMRKSQGKMTRK